MPELTVTVRVPLPKQPTMAALERAIFKSLQAAGREVLLQAFGVLEGRVVAGAKQRRRRRYLITRFGEIRFFRWQTRTEAGYGYPLDEALELRPGDRDCTVVAKDQIRTVVRTFRDKLPEIFPGPTEVPETLIFAKSDAHADDIVEIVREEFGKGNEFAAKITYKSGSQGQEPEDLLASFRNSYNPRIASAIGKRSAPRGADARPATAPEAPGPRTSAG